LITYKGLTFMGYTYETISISDKLDTHTPVQNGHNFISTYTEYS